MAFEVHSGERPARRARQLLVSAGLLVATLGLALLQVRHARALGPRQQIEGTPLSVRPPRGWHLDRRNPQRFVLPVVDESRRRRGLEFERSMEFDFLRLPNFEPLTELLRMPEVVGGREHARVSPVQLGKYPGLEVERSGLIRLGRDLWRRRTVVRFTCLPRGHLLRVVYEPLGELRPADLEILDDVCRTLQIDDPTLNASPQDYLACAGLSLPLEDDWMVVGADFPQVPGLYIGGMLNEVPAWSIGLLRTWLAEGRGPQDLLRDLAAHQWLAWEVDDWLREDRRADGARVVWIRPPETGWAGSPISSAGVVQQSPSQAIILLVYTAVQFAPSVEKLAERLAGQVKIGPLEAFPSLSLAESNGLRLVADLGRSGPAPRWGRETLNTTYRRLHRDETVLTQRGAVNRDPSQGYQGLQVRRIGQSQEERIIWTTDRQADAYKWQADFLYGSSSVRVVEQRSRPGGSVTRQVWVDERLERRWTFNPGPTFVAPPAESIIKGWVARGEPQTILIEVSTPVGPATHTLLLRHLPPDGDYPRVLVQQDYWPLGSIEAYDDARAETQYEIYPAAEYRRVK